jgi:hypothetical protein
MAFEDELDDILRELLREPGVIAAALARTGEEPFAAETNAGVQRRLPLGGGVELVALVDAEGQGRSELSGAFERCARELRACTRVWGREPPELSLMGRTPRTRQALLARIGRFLEAFANTQGAVGACVLRGPEVVAIGGAIDEARMDRLAFLRKRVDAAGDKLRGKTSHAAIDGEDFFACSFGFDAYLVAFFDKPWSLDFVRHRVKMVTRELASILPHLDDPPEAPAKISPLPE